MQEKITFVVFGLRRRRRSFRMFNDFSNSNLICARFGIFKTNSCATKYYALCVCLELFKISLICTYAQFTGL